MTTCLLQAAAVPPTPVFLCDMPLTLGEKASHVGVVLSAWGIIQLAVTGMRRALTKLQNFGNTQNIRGRRVGRHGGKRQLSARGGGQLLTRQGAGPNKFVRGVDRGGNKNKFFF